MYKAFFAGSDLLHLPIFSLVLFLTLFIGILGWVYLGRRGSSRFDEIARLPFADEPHPGGDRHV